MARDGMAWTKTNSKWMLIFHIISRKELGVGVFLDTSNISADIGILLRKTAHADLYFLFQW
jgi:hypothetical protein